MRERVELLLGRGTRGMWVMTFHAACARILRAEAAAARLHAPVHDLRPGRRAPAGQALGRRRRRRPQALHPGRDPQPDLGRQEPPARRGRLPRAGRLVVRGDGRRRLRALRARAAPHERDGLRRPAVARRQPAGAVRGGARALLARPSATCSSTSTRTPTTRSTGCCSCWWGAPAAAGRRAARGSRARGPLGHRNLAVVGDDAQSIYGFRGADIRNILDFEQDFPDARVVKLEQNYRSTQTILSRRQRRDRAQPRRDRQAAVERARAGRADPAARARRRARRGALRGRRDRAAASTRASRARRSPSSTAPTRSRACSRTRSCAREIAYQVIGGTKFYERAEIKDAIAYLSLLANPSDVVSFTRVANSPRRGIGQTSLSRVLAHADDARRPGVGGRARSPSRCPASAPPRSRRSGASWTR